MRKRWRCFHCDEVFTSHRWAAEHFGANESSFAACQINGHEGHLITYIRKLEDQLAGYRTEDGDIMRAMYAMEANHRQALIRAEEDGYNKGVREAMSAVMGFASFRDGSFELIVRDDKTGLETTLVGTLTPGQLEIVDRILPTCAFVPVENRRTQPLTSAKQDPATDGR